MNRRDFIRNIFAGGIGTISTAFLQGCRNTLMPPTKKWKWPWPSKPNFVVILCDDLGYSDIGCFGAEGIETPNLDKMADEGMRFTDFYVTASCCSPSRASLMTGCYPQRVGITKVLYPSDQIGLSSNESTIADILKQRGYTTACIGKWHIGHHTPFSPLRHGFDEYFEMSYSNSKGPKNTKGNEPNLPLVENENVIKVDPDQAQITASYTEKAVRFIEKNRGKRFFLYLPHSMPHVPLNVSDKFKGKSSKGLYGDVVMEIDWSAGEILKTLKRLDIDKNTLVIFTSDNGPWLSKGEQGGSAKPLRGGKATYFEGGFRVPMICRWPGKIPAGTICSEPVSTIDILPTFAKLAGAELSANKIDGGNIWPLMTGAKNAKSPHEAIYYYRGDCLRAVRSGRWKLLFEYNKEAKEQTTDKSAESKAVVVLYDLQNDISETTDVSAGNPEVVERLKVLADIMRLDLGDSCRGIDGKNRRPPGQVQ